MKKHFQFGETVDGYAVPVLNEREIRAAAGILFLATFLSLMFIAFESDFVPIKFVIPVFLADFLVRVFVNPRYAPSLVAARLIVFNQTPEYVAARPKRLAWMIGVVLAGIMLLLMVILNSYSVITGIICLLCLIFLFFESVFGICLGCKFYKLVYREEPTLCPGEVCEVRTRHEIQKTSKGQVALLLGFIVLIAIAGVTLGPAAARTPPHALFQGASEGSAH